MEKVVEMKKITKVFPGVKANDEIDFDLNKSEVHVLLGENGAGKTTLMNILYGLYQQTSGDIFIRGEKMKVDNPNVAIEQGIGMVHQHFMLVKPFTVVENIILGNETKKNAFSLDMEKARKEVVDISEKYGLEVDPDAKIQDISVGMQQRVEILKALYKGADILILDEPTAVLTPQEIEELGVILDRLKEKGKSIILITHKLKEVMAMSDRVTVIRSGKKIQTLLKENTNTDELAEIMVGREVDLVTNKADKEPGEKILDVKDLKALNNRDIPALKGINFTVNKGEIFALAGVDGNGQTELIEVLTGLRDKTEGKINFKGEEISELTTHKRIQKGISHIPEDRHKRGMVLQHSLAENSILGDHNKKPFSENGQMNYKAIHKYARKLIKDYDVRTPNENVTGSSLSGGNQQKLIVAREITRDPDLLIAAQPTRGVDVGAIEFIHEQLVEQRDQNKAVLLISLELDEVMNLADRIGVIYDGKIVGIIDAKDATEKKLGIMMAGGSID